MSENSCCFIHNSLLLYVLGVFSAAHELKMEWVVIKGISGYADGTKVKETWQTFASVTAASLVANILNQCSIFEDWPHYKGKQINFYFLGPQYICLQSQAGLVCRLVLCSINMLEPNY